jgi:glycosyltransferase involved in cell wall biosynthesis
MKLNWFSPLPPARTGIADYTAGLLPHLRRRAEVALWTDQDEWDPTLEAHARVRRYAPESVPWADLNRADATFYHLGNNLRFHGGVYRVSRRHAGVVVLHDYQLQHLFLMLCREFFDYDFYRDAMSRHYGAAGGQAAEAYWAGLLAPGDLAETYPLTPLALEAAAAAVVHTPAAFADLRAADRWPVVYAPLPCFRAAPPPTPRPPGPPYRLIVFGHLGPNRRLDALLQALAEQPRRDLFRLDVYGEVLDGDALGRQVERCGLRERVAVHGFVPEAQLDRALAAAHLAVNLRYPSMGEASASQLRIWEHALPSLVTRVGWYATLPEDVVAFVRVEREADDLRGCLAAFADRPEDFARMGENGRRLLRLRHGAEAYVDAVLRAAEFGRDFGPRRLLRGLTDRVGRELSWWADAETEGAFGRAAREIYRLAG